MAFPIDGSIPAASHNPSNDQPLMQQNFANIVGFLTVDHVAPGTSAQDGQHNQVRFAINQSAPGLSSAVGEIFANTNELFFNNATRNVQLTNLPITTGANPGTAGGSLNFFDTPWNMRVYYGRSGAVSGGTVNFPTPYTTLFFASAVCDDVNPHFVSCQQFTTNLSLHADASVASIAWFAFGRL